jgi:hypothetical protein
MGRQMRYWVLIGCARFRRALRTLTTPELQAAAIMDASAERSSPKMSVSTELHAAHKSKT